MKWKTRHRPEESSQSSFSPDSPIDANDVLPQFPLPPDVIDIGSVNLSPQTTPRPSPQLGVLLITNDIEALLEEDERTRAQERQEQQEREAKLGNQARIALPEVPSSDIHALPPPPRRPQRTAHHKIQSEFQIPMPSGQSPEASFERIEESKGTKIQRPSTFGGVASSPSVSRRPSIKDLMIDSRAFRRTSSIDTYTMHNTLSPDEVSIINRLSEFGPKPSRRSADDPERESWSTASSFSGTGHISNAAGTSPSSLVDTLGESMAQNPSRPLLSHASFISQASALSAVSSVDPASTINEPRISISSTIYPASAYNELPSPVAAPVGIDQLGSGHRDSLFYNEADSVCSEDRKQSIVDTSTPVECETPVPQRTSYPSHLGIYPISDKLISDIRSRPPSRPLSSASSASTRRISGQKPALPTAPKPDFRRSRSVQPPSRTPMISKPPSRSSSPKLPGLVPYHLLTSFSTSDSNRNDSLPPTTNYLNPQERTELIRKTRKLAQVFGQTPSPISGSDDLVDSPALTNCLLPMTPSRKVHARGAMSVPDAIRMPGAKSLRESQFPSISAARTNSLSPIRFRSSNSCTENESDDSMSPFDSPDAATPQSLQKRSSEAVVRSPTLISGSDSFIEMADQDGHGIKRLPSLYSFAESLTEEQRAEEERRRKREKLAKLHRFLGSRVPMELVVGHSLDVPLPPLASDSKLADPASDGEASPASKLWLLAKRRNSLASSDPLEQLGDSERLKEELSDKEKAAAVKRALKMEKVFGEQPPQDLFHLGRTRPMPRVAVRAMSDSKVAAVSAPSSPVGGNINKSAYRKQKRRSDRPGTAESSKRLLGESESINEGQSDIYYHYRNSLVSLTNIVDNDDRRSLVELHEYINEDLSMGSRDKHESYSTSSIRSERRRSLPLRASYSSLASQCTISESKMETTPFEVRRRRAAKLSHFFGVSYRDLFGQVLDSLEMSVREDEGKGTLNADEAKDLLVQLTKLKARRNELS